MKTYKHKLGVLSEIGFVPERTVQIVDMIYKVGSPYPKEIICKWWAVNDIGERLLIEEKILKCEEK